LRLLAFQAPRAATEKKTLNEAAPAARAPAMPAGPAPVEPSAVPSAAAANVRPVVASPAEHAAPPAALSRTPDVARAAAPTAPPGRVLPVVDASPERVRQRAPANGHAAGEVVGVPVHVPPESAREQPTGAPQVVPTEDGDFWQATVADLVAREAITALVRELALQSQLVARDEGHWMLRVERESLNQPTSRERLKRALQAAGHDVALTVEVGAVSDSPARRIAAAQAERQRAAEAVIHNDPFVQAMMRDFGARIVPGSIKPAGRS
jgi:DNA polymerase III subunit gamma/tau